MANEIKAKFTANAVDLYACVFNSLKQVYDVIGASWVTWDDANIDNYDIALAENGGGGLYFADFPALAAGVYTVIVYQGTQIATDEVVGSGVMNWDGTAEIVYSGAVKLAADGLDDIAVVEPSGDSAGWSFPQKLLWLIMRFLHKHTSDNFNGIRVHKADDSVATTQPVTDISGVKAVGPVE
jgi:hypothetical protein